LNFNLREILIVYVIEKDINAMGSMKLGNERGEIIYRGTYNGVPVAIMIF
jgi:hypothetical protein